MKTRLPRAVQAVALLLVVIGAIVAAGRVTWIGDSVSRSESVRIQVFQFLQLNDPNMARRPQEVYRFDGRFGDHPVLTLLHVVPGGLFLIFAMLQFSSRIRRWQIGFHRWNGRILLLIAFVCVPSGLYFSLHLPFAGLGEAVPTLLFGGIFLTALGFAWVAIRKHEVNEHREWMIRAFAVAAGISTVRIVSIILDLAMSPFGFSPQQVFVCSIWTGWLLTLAAGEFWIRHTRSSEIITAENAESAERIFSQHSLRTLR